MEDQRFDQLSRQFASLKTRRQALKAIAGAVVAAIAGSRATPALACTAHYSPCQDDTACCAGAVCEYGLCMPGCRINGAFINAGMSPPENICAVCQPATNTTSLVPANEGMSCWSGDPNAGSTFCRSGSCVPNAPQSCPPPTSCHLEGSVNPATGMCVNPPAPAGTPCGNGATCYGDLYQPADACDGNGFCVSGGARTRSCAPYRCGVNNQCATSCAGDADCASNAHCDGGQCFNDAGLGVACDEDSDCTSGICSDGVCCDRRCDERCKTCSAANGGRCSPVVCDDGLACTSGTCQEATGQCVHAINPGTCLINGVCYASGAANPQDGCLVCDPARGNTAWSARACPTGTVCSSGACQPICLDTQAACNPADNQCCNGRCEDVPGCGGDGVPQCCFSSGAPCQGSCDCCSPNTCIGGVCCRNTVGATCDEQRICCSGLQCLNGRCQPKGCGVTQDVCNPANNQCCQDEPTNCEAYDATFSICCHPNGGSCFDQGDCCDPNTCRSGACCLAETSTCSSSIECCPGLECANGRCLVSCPLGGFRCGFTCCASYQHCVNGACTCVALQGACNSANNLCCQEQETLCPASNPYGNANTCCRPQGGGCSSAADCCYEVYDSAFGRDTCGDDGICGGNGAYCQSAGDCVAGRSCYGACFGVGLGFILCQTNGDCPEDVNGNASTCRQKRCVYENELPG